jgi:hypothetical protein
LVRLAQAQCDTAIPLIVRFALVGITRIADANSKTPAGARDVMRDSVLAFFESTRESTRSAALEWLESHIEHPLIANHAEFWRHALETPFDDLRLRLVSLLDRAEQPGSISLAQHDAWRQVLVNIHRGTRLKPFVIARLQEAIAASPETADANLRALALAARSVREPERRAALTALVQLFATRPEVRSWIGREIPELKVSLAGEEIASDEHAIK